MNEPFGVLGVDLENIVIEIKKLLPSVLDRLNTYDRNMSTVIDSITILDNKFDTIDKKIGEYLLKFKDYENRVDMTINNMRNDFDKMENHMGFIEKRIEDHTFKLTEVRTLAFALKAKLTNVIIVSFTVGFFIELLLNKSIIMTKIMSLL